VPFGTHSSEKRFVGTGTITEDFVRMDTNVRLKGEVIIKFYHESKIAGMQKHDPLFRIHFHTSFQVSLLWLIIKFLVRLESSPKELAGLLDKPA
jgi:hypothetical protein